MINANGRGCLQGVAAGCLPWAAVGSLPGAAAFRAARTPRGREKASKLGQRDPAAAQHRDAWVPPVHRAKYADRFNTTSSSFGLY